MDIEEIINKIFVPQNFCICMARLLRYIAKQSGPQKDILFKVNNRFGFTTYDGSHLKVSFFHSY